MYQKAQLDLLDVRAALQAMLQAAPSKTQQPLALAIVDDYGELMCFARMDGTTPLSRDWAVKKAYTASRMRSDLRKSAEQFQSRGRTVSDFADPNLIGSNRGGVVITRPSDGVVLGAIGVSGGAPDEDDEVARIGLQALNL